MFEAGYKQGYMTEKVIEGMDTPNAPGALMKAISNFISREVDLKKAPANTVQALKDVRVDTFASVALHSLIITIGHTWSSNSSDGRAER
jgi:hypothetical protein